MSNNTQNAAAAQNSDTVITGVTQVITEMVADWDLDQPAGVTPQTSLMADLEFESIDIVQLAVSLEQHFDQSGLPFEQLFMQDGDYVEDLSVSQIADFMREQMNG